MSDTKLILPSEAAAPGPRPMIVADNAHVTYHVYASGKKLSARDKMFSLSAARGGGGMHEVHALRGVTFTASQGETIGVVGHNGSGKSTLFKAMSGLIPTSEGTIRAAARPVLLGVNAALMPDLSGEDNIKLGLLAMGFTPQEAAAQVDPIADFAELNEFIHHPMRTYSSGMAARLKFAIGAAKTHSILLIDEALSVGDRRFRTKSERRIAELRDNAGLVMIVSHSTGSLRGTCDRVLWIHKGELRADGDTRTVINEYTRWTKNPGNAAVGAASVSRTGKGPTSATKPSGAKPSAAKPKPTAKSAPDPAGPTTVAETAQAGSSAAGGLTPKPRTPVTDTDLTAVTSVESTRTTIQPTQAKPIAQGKAAGEPELSLFDELLKGLGPETIHEAAEATTGSIPVDRATRANARRARYQEAAKKRLRRRTIAAVVTGAAILLAVGVGAAFALLANSASNAGLLSSDSAARQVGAQQPVIVNFDAGLTPVACAKADSKGIAKFNWEIIGASYVAVAPTSTTVDPAFRPDTLPQKSTSYELPFDCSKETESYTLTAENANGTSVTKVLVVKRALASPSPTPVAPKPKPSAPAPAPSAPAVQPAPQPSQPPVEQPLPTVPPADPSPAPDPSDPPVETPAPPSTPEPQPTVPTDSSGETPTPVESPAA